MKIMTIDPVAFSIGSYPINWYGLLIGTAVILGMLLAMREAKRRGLDSEIIIDLLIVVIPLAIIGARLYYVLFKWSDYADHPIDMIKVWEGGLAIHGGLIAALITAYFFTKKRGISFLLLADIAAPSIILGQAIGRWGNFFNQEAYGREVSLAFLEKLHLPQFIIDQMHIQGAYYHPTFLYESLWCLLGCIVLILFRKTNPIVGVTFSLYLIWYSVARVFIEGLRTDSLMLFDTIKMAQIVSALGIIIGVALIVWVTKTKQKRYLEVAPQVT